MTVNYSKQFNTRAPRKRISQSQPIPGSAQVANSGGGFSWQVTPWQKLERFLILGAEGGTYYVTERDLINQSHAALQHCLKEDGVKAVKIITDVSLSGRAYKNDPAIFALAVALTHGSPNVKAAAYHALPKVCRIGTHLFHFAEYVNAMRGWGRGLRRAVGAWYDKAPDKLALQAIKYQQRDGWAHGDLLRLSHQVARNDGQAAVFTWMLKGLAGFDQTERTVKRKIKGTTVDHRYQVQGKDQLPKLILAFEEAKTASETRLIELITEHSLPREAVPTDKLSSAKVWEALLQHMPLTAMVRSLGKMSAVGLLQQFSDAQKLVVERLGDQERLTKSRIHPMQVLLALKTYSSGHGDKGSLRWDALPRIVDALDQAFYLTFKNVVPSNKRVLLAIDVSGSMDSSMIAGTTLSAREGSAAMALITAATEPNYEIIAFSAANAGYGGRWGGGEPGITQVKITPRMRMDSVLDALKRVPMGGTDCALPMLWASRNRLSVDGFITYTDNETWAGAIHPAQALRQYRKDFVDDAKAVVVGMVTNDFTIADPEDSGMMDVVGFDANAPSVMADFLRGAPVKAEAAEEESPAVGEP